MLHEDFIRFERACSIHVDDAFKRYPDEATFLRKATEFLEEAGALAIRQAYSTKKGTSDIICCFTGKFIAVEVKDETGKPSAHQRKFIHDVQRAGGIAGVCDCLRDIEKLLRLAISR